MAQNNKIARKRLRRILLAVGTASGTLCFANPALATCVIAPGGTGTVANPGPNSTVVCTGTTSGIDVATISPDVQVRIEGGSQVNGVAGTSEIQLEGSQNRVILGGGAIIGPAILTDTNLVIIGDGARLDVTDSTTIDLTGNGSQQLVVEGNGASIGIGAGGQVTVAQPLRLGGAGATFYLDPLATLSAASNFTGNFTGDALIAGGADTQVFYLEGHFETKGGFSATVLDAGDGDDLMFITASTRFLPNATAGSVPTFILNGGSGADALYFDNSVQLGSFNSIGIETLIANNGFSRLRGAHQFQEIRVTQGQLDVFDDAALGAANGTLNLVNSGHLRFFGTSSQQFTQSITGSGIFEYGSGSNEFSTSNNISGQFLISGGTPIISHSNAFGTALVTNYATVVLRDVVITNTLTGNGNYIIDGTSTALDGANSMNGAITVQSGRLTVSDVAALGNGLAFIPAAITIAPTARLTLDMSGSGTLGNALSGSGTLEKYLAGGLTINRSNTGFTGQVNLFGGRTFLNADNALGTGTIFFAGGAINPGDVIVANSLTGNGVIEKNSAGLTQLLGNNSQFSGTIIANAGTIRVTGNSGLGSTNVILATSGVLQLDTASGSMTIANVISGAGKFRKSGAGQVDLTGANTFGGGTIIDAGTLRVTGPAPLGTGAIAVASGASLVFENAASATFTNAMSGAGTFRKLGAGQLAFTNPLSIGALAVDAGRVRINAAVTANATIASGASLDGTGRIIGNLTNNGTVAPGNSIGTLTVQGNYVHSANSVLEIEFDAAGNIDLLAVTGTATLNGGTLRFVSLGGAEGSGGTFLTATGGVTGTFANVQTVGAQLPLAVIYQTNSAIMAPSVLTARPSTFNAQFLAAADSAFGFADRVSGAAAGGPQGKRLWLQGFGADGNRSAAGTTLGYGHDGYGIAGGIVLPVSERLSLGAAVGWNRSKIALSANGGSGEQDAVLGSLNLRYAAAGFALEAGAIYGSVNQETLRNVSFNGFSASVNGATTSKLYGGYLGLRGELASLGEWHLAASARASLAHQTQAGFTESGSSPLRLAVPELSVDTAEVQGGLGLSRQLAKANLYLDLGARLIDNLGDRAIPVAFAASAAGVTLQGDTRGAVHGYARVGVEFALSNRASLTLGYAGQIGQTDRHEGRVGLSIGF